MNNRTLIFRVIAGCLSVGMACVAGLLVFWGASGEVPWVRVVPSIIGQCVFGITFGMFALGFPGPFNRASGRKVRL